MFYFYIVLSVILSLCIIILCLLQHSQKDNASGIAFSNSTFQEVMGTTETKNTVSRLTLLFILILFFLCILAYRDKSKSLEVPDVDLEALKKHGNTSIIDEDMENLNEEDNNNNNNDNNVNEKNKDNKNNEDSYKDNGGDTNTSSSTKKENSK